MKFNRRQVNKVAHAIAGETTLSTSPIVYFYIPHYINDLNLICNKIILMLKDDTLDS